MQGRFKESLHLLNALPVFESAARLESFTAAGRELGLKQPTVSRHIMNLEEDLGVVLFERDHNKLKITEDGRRLAAAVALGFSHVDRVIQDIRARGAKTGLTFACTLSFSHCWLMPRFGAFRRALDGHVVDVYSSYYLRDLDMDRADLLVSWMDKPMTDWPRIPLFSEIVYPVCSPTFASRYASIQGEGTAPAIIAELPLLFCQRFAPDFLGWEDWFDAQSILYHAPKDAYDFDNYAYLMQAAIDGEGVALAWDHLTDQYIEKGELIRIGPAVKGRSPAYWLEYRDERLPSQLTQKIVTWFKDQSDF